MYSSMRSSAFVRDRSGGLRQCLQRLALIVMVGCGSSPATHDDAGPPDAGPSTMTDAMVDTPPEPTAAFHVDPLAGPIHRSLHAPDAAIELTVTSDSAAALVLTANVTGSLGVDASACASLAPGATCTVRVHNTATQLGTRTGSVLLSAGATTVTVPVVVTVEAFAQASAGPGGSVTSDPPEVGCPGCYPVGTVVTLTATPAAGFHFLHWADQGGVPHTCEANPCTVTASATQVWNEAIFEADPHDLAIHFTGDGPGTVAIQTSVGFVFCTGSCTVVVDTPTIQVIAATLVDFAGFGAPCGPDEVCTLPGDATSLDVAFSKRPGETDLDVHGGESVDFDPANELVIGGETVRAFTAALAPKWTAQVSGAARFAANGDVLVRSGSQIIKLAAADGHVLWRHATPPPSFQPWGLAHQHAATPAGGAVVNHYTFVELWAPDGASKINLPIGFARAMSVATGADGRIYVGVASADFPFDYFFVEVFSAAGVRELPDFGSALPMGVSDTVGPSSIAVGTANVAVAARGADWVGFEHFAADRSLLGKFELDYRPGSMFDLSLHLVATNAADQLAFAYRPDFLGFSPWPGLALVRFDAARHEVSRVERPPLFGGDAGLQSGFDLADLAIAPDGRIAALDAHSLLEVFAP